MTLYLIGEPESKRRQYFEKACRAQDIRLEHIDMWCFPEDVGQPVPKSGFIKIDPPTVGTSAFGALDAHVVRYKSYLEALGERPYHYLNTPQAILDVLDKKHCKTVLRQNGIPTAPVIETSGINSARELDDRLCAKRMTAVFIKPQFGSGAAGVLAYRVHPKTRDAVLYTALAYRDGRFHNTKNLRKITDRSTIDRFVEHALQTPHLVERWQPKPSTPAGMTYDLRAVFQFGRLDFLVARGAKSSPITNLHLNNGAIDLEALAYEASDIAVIEALCHRAVGCFSGLNSAGIDLIYNPKTKKASVIEINAQGDLIYKDIYNDNRIYTRQIQGMRQPYGR